MPRTIDGVEAWARDDANDRRDGKSWNSWCESFVYRAGGFDGSFPSAMLAGDASGPLDRDWRTAQRGEIHYWAGVGGFGHVAFELGGGLLLMASASVTDRWGVDMGTIPFRTYALKGIHYRGHTYRHGTQTLTPSREEDDMGYSSWTQQEKDDLHRDFWNGVGYRIRWANHEGHEVFPIDILVGADGNAAHARSDARITADALTPGETGRKFDGVTYAQNKETLRLLALLIARENGDVDEAQLAKELAPVLGPTLVAALGADVVTDSDLARFRTDLFAQLAKLPEATLAAAGLKRA